jgi:hypothetical protein
MGSKEIGSVMERMWIVFIVNPSEDENGTTVSIKRGKVFFFDRLQDCQFITNSDSRR